MTGLMLINFLRQQQRFDKLDGRTIVEVFGYPVRPRMSNCEAAAESRQKAS